MTTVWTEKGTNRPGSVYLDDTVDERVTSSSASAVALIIKGAAGQFANLTEWQNDVGTVLTRIDPNGHMYFRDAHILSNGSSPGSFYLRAGSYYFQGLDGASTPLQANTSFNPTVVITSTSAGNPVLTTKGAASQTADLQQWQDSGGTRLSSVMADGRFYTNSSMSIGPVQVATSTARLSATTVAATEVGAIIRGANSQTADLQQWQNSAGTVLSRISSTGNALLQTSSISADTTAFVDPQARLSVGTSISTVKGLTVKGVASQSGDLQQWQNSSGMPGLAVIPNPSGIGFADLALRFRGSGDGNPELTIYNTGLFQLERASRSISIRGAASQSADLQQWQNSAGTVLARVRNDGALFFSTIIGEQAQVGPYIEAGTATVPLKVRSRVATSPAFAVQGVASQSADLQQWQDANGVALTKVGATGIVSALAVKAVGTRTDTPNVAQLEVLPNSATNVGAVVKGAASQSVDLQQWQNSAGTVLAAMKPDGYFTTLRLATGNSYGVVAGDHILQGTMAAAKTLVVQGAASQTGDLTQWQNSAGTVMAKFDANGNLGFVGGNPSISSTGNIYFDNGGGGSFIMRHTSAAAVALAVRGAASQTGDIQQWQNSAGTLLARIDSGGSFFTIGGDLEVQTASKGLILKSPNGTRYRVTVTDTGTLQTAAA